MPALKGQVEEQARGLGGRRQIKVSSILGLNGDTSVPLASFSLCRRAWGTEAGFCLHTVAWTAPCDVLAKVSMSGSRLPGSLLLQ